MMACPLVLEKANSLVLIRSSTPDLNSSLGDFEMSRLRNQYINVERIYVQDEPGLSRA
jgi:hypothetical protein